MFSSILVPIDIAHRSSWQFALPEAMELATASRASLTVMTVVRDLNLIFEAVHLPMQLEHIVTDARTRLAGIVAGYPTDDLQIDQEVRVGSIGHEILAAAETRGTDLIVMASHRPEMRDYFIGPNAGYVAQHAPCSVLVLRKFAVLPGERR